MSYIGSPPAPNIAGVEVTPTEVSDQANSSTGYFDLPSGTTAQRPGTPAVGMMRYNTTESQYEVYNGTDWVSIDTSPFPYTVDFLVVAGGGGAGGWNGSTYGSPQSGGSSSIAAAIISTITAT